MPTKNHQAKYTQNMIMGFIGIVAGITSIFYACFEKTKITDWYFWSIIASMLICTGLYLLTQAVVHKVKADLKRRQKHKEQHSTFTADAL